MTDYQTKFQQLLRELFQFDCADLDFGIYRIMNYKRQVIEQFIGEELPKAIALELEQGALAEQTQAAKDLEAARTKVLEALGEDALDAAGNLVEPYRATKAGKAYLAAQERAKSAKGREALEAAIYNHLYAFFSRYWQDGDFISKRRYSKKERYAIPYNGEEVYLYWANHDQYYVKTGEYFTDYTWKAPNGVIVHFKLQAADVEQNNVKGEKRFFLPRLDEIAWDETAQTLTIPFEFRPLTAQEAIAYGSKNQQETIIAKAVEEIPKRLSPKAHAHALAALSATKKRSDGSTITLLEHHLRQYTRRNTSDFFIHKDPKGFLSRELDFYLKNEVLNLDEMEVAGEGLSEGWFQLLRLIKKVGGHIIDFLAQIEEFQKMLWEKRKFVTETFYCITVGNIPQEFYPEIAACEAQWEEWQKLYGIQIPPSPPRGEGKGEGAKSRTKAERSALITELARDKRQAPTEAEQRLWHYVRDRRLGGYKFRRQHPIDRYIVDFICIERRLIIELDGSQHAEAEQRQKDEERTRFFESRGFRVLRFWNHEVLTNTEGVLEAILDALEAPHPGPLPKGERESSLEALPKGERESFLETHPTLVLDTRHFSADFTDLLLASYEGLDEMTDGLLVHSENWQALNLLTEKYRERVKCVYIDPPFNTGSDEFIYKDSYQHASWLSFIVDRVRKSWGSLASNGAMFLHLDDNESHLAKKSLDFFLPAGAYQNEIIWAYGGSARGAKAIADRLPRNHDSILLFAKSANELMLNRVFVPLRVHKDDAKKQGYRVDEKGRWFKTAPRGDYTDESIEKLHEQERIYETSSGTIRIKYYLRVDGDYVVEDRLVGDVWSDIPDMMHSPESERIGFDTQKPLKLIVRILRLASNSGDHILDYFAGSGTTGHAVINLNREDGGRRKFILVEMAHYFDTVLLPRIKKVTFSPEWKDGKPLTPALSPQGRGRRAAPGEGWMERSPRIVKVIRLESYEDALNNISFDDASCQQAMQFEDYLLQYMLRWETRHSETLLNVEKLAKPFSYQLHLHRDGETRVQPVDLPETFAYLIGLYVHKRQALTDNGRRYLVYRGETREGRRTAVIWRETEGWTQADYERDRDFVAAQGLTDGADEVFVNGDSFIPGARALEKLFKERMFATVED